MVFKELEIQGFKSFPDKVKITFDEGVTGVVGPNGSGKSNLSDAVRWVLGETSARQLRAAGKMEDVIFGGTRRRGAMGFAQVRLTLDNSSHALDVEADEVTIGRRYYRSGESEYSINGQICRLKDVYELLLDTGIGRDGYSVIGQGRIAEIVAAKSSERREIFEEACGIAKYRYRKNEAERRLAAAAENLERLRDILGELEARVGPLEKESEKARKFLELSARRKTLEVTLWTDGVHRAKEAVRRQVRDYETAQADYERFDRQTKAAESEAEEIRMQAQQLTIAVERLNGDIRSITEQISGSESRIAVLENDIARNEESAADLRAEIAAGQQDSTEAAAALERHRAVAKSMELAGRKLAAELDALNDELVRLTRENDQSGARRDTLRGEVAALTARHTEAQVAQAAAEAAAETALSRLPALEEAAEVLAVQRDDAKQDLEDTVRYLTTLAENEQQLKNIRAGLELKLKSRRAALEESLTALAARSGACQEEIEAIRRAKTDSTALIAAKEAEIREATEKRLLCQKDETEALAKGRAAADEREEMGREMARLAERKAAAEGEYDQMAAKLWDEYQLTLSQAEELCVEFENVNVLRAQVADLRGKIRALGNVNVSAIEEYQEVKVRYDTLRAQVEDVEGSRNELTRMIASLSGQMKEIFTDSFRAINDNFGRIFAELFGGGEASLVLEDESDVLSCGIGIQVAPPGKVIKNLEALSGGEQALVAISIYFAILAVNPAPFCILDEIEAALDDANVSRFAQYLRRVSDKTQFIVITHRRGTMEAANVLYGVTMQEDGVSKLLKLDLEQVDATLVS